MVFSTTLEKVGAGARLVRDDADGLVDEFRLFVNPVDLGGGTPFFPPLAGRIGLELVESRTIGSPVVYVRYRVRAAATTRQVIDSPSGAS